METDSQLLESAERRRAHGNGNTSWRCLWANWGSADTDSYVPCAANFCSKSWSRCQGRMDLLDSGMDNEVKLIASSDMDTKETD